MSQMTIPPVIPMGNPPRSEPLIKGSDSPDYTNVLACIRCGLCLSVCPTYNVEREEVQSPRGRVALIRAAQEGRLSIKSPELREHMYHCLDCRACQTICPSGVRVGELVLAMRAQTEAAQKHSFLEWLVRLVALRVVLTSAASLERFMPLFRLYCWLGLQGFLRQSRLLELLPRKLQFLAEMEGLLPGISGKSLHEELPEIVSAKGQKRARVGFFLGCMMSTILTNTSRATVEVLRHNGVEVVTPPDQWCCGAPHAEEGDRASQRQFARHNIELFERYEANGEGLDCIVTDCAACGAELKGYAELLRDEPKHSSRALAFSEKVRDISEYLLQIDFSEKPSQSPKNLEGTDAKTITYHEPCHLCHAQGIRKPPRALIGALPGTRFVELGESDWCCGSAGVYNITHVERAQKVLDRKMEKVAKTEAELLLTGNPGCLLQLKNGVRKSGQPIRVIHPVEALAESYGIQVGSASSWADLKEVDPERSGGAGVG